jgi:hypothetical protein
MTPWRPRRLADVAKRVCIILVVLWHVVTKHVQHIDWGRADGIASLCPSEMGSEIDILSRKISNENIVSRK